MDMQGGRGVTGLAEVVTVSLMSGRLCLGGGACSGDGEGTAKAKRKRRGVSVLPRRPGKK